MTNAFHIATDQNWQDETTIFWFELDGETYGIAESGPTTDVLDADGCPMPQGWERVNAERQCIVTDEMRANA